MGSVNFNKAIGTHLNICQTTVSFAEALLIGGLRHKQQTKILTLNKMWTINDECRK